MIRQVMPILICLLSTAIFAQDLEVKATQANAYLSTQTLTKTQIVDELGAVINEVVSRGPEVPAGKTVQTIIDVTTKASTITIEASDKDRSPVLVTKVGESRYSLGPSKSNVWVRVDVIDFDLKLFANKTIVVPPAGPVVDPDPPKPIDPDPPKPVDPDPPVVDNKYGVGAVADKYAPDHAATRAIYARHYRQAASFLYGIPTLKAVNNANGNTPENNVFYWLADEAQKMQCPDLETCEQWATFREEIAKALNASQTSRKADGKPFTKSDWRFALLEIATALDGEK